VITQPSPQAMTEIINTCSVCRSQKTSFWREVYDDRYGHPDSFNLIQCDECHHLMTVPMMTEEDLANLYGTYYPRKKISVDDVISQAAEVELPFNKLLRWWKGVDNQGQSSASAGKKMLDIGCGSGLSLLEAQKSGAEVWGIEADPNVVRIANALNLRIHQGNLYDKPFEGIYFDLIVMNQVIEHIPEPDKMLELIRTRLSDEGRVIMVFPNVNSLWSRVSGKRWINWHIPYHLHHFSIRTFSKMVERCGYNIVSTRTITPNAWTVLQLRTMKQATLRGQVNPIWNVTSSNSTSGTRVNTSKLLRRLLLFPIGIGIALVNRIVDFFGLGDSLLVELKPVNKMR
jgi:2-polyprenyl-3-methyl-5-hydroxy-6-metoxy-1,4-benzoquinol methylase